MFTKTRIRAAAYAAPLGFLALALAAKAVDPTLADVATEFATYVSAILTFAMAIIGGFILAALVPKGLKKLWQYVKKLLGAV